MSLYAFLTGFRHAPYDPSSSPTFINHFSSPWLPAFTSPLTQFWTDVGSILASTPLLPKLLQPFATLRKTDELYPLPPESLSMVWWATFSLLQIPPLFLVVVASVSLLTFGTVVRYLHSLLIWSAIQGPQLQVHPPVPAPDTDPRQRWVFINGIATGAHGLSQNLTVLSSTFHAPVLGVHNRTYGFLGDLVECVLQRSFGYRTIETRLAVPILEAYLEDTDAVGKVVLVGHSQGGICVGHVLEQVYADVSWDKIHGRLEVFTFGSAALSCKNPWYDRAKRQRLVPVMEHYCHELDMVASFGALATIRRQENPFKGKVFVCKGKGGHLLDQHYLKGMFGEDSMTEGGFLMGRISRYGDEGEKKGRWYVEPGAKTRPGQKRVKDVSMLWRYMNREVEDGEGRRNDSMVHDDDKVVDGVGVGFAKTNGVPKRSKANKS